ILAQHHRAEHALLGGEILGRGAVEAHLRPALFVAAVLAPAELRHAHFVRPPRPPLPQPPPGRVRTPARTLATAHRQFPELLTTAASRPYAGRVTDGHSVVHTPCGPIVDNPATGCAQV